MTSNLTPKQETFCQKYIETGDATKAYYASYDAKGSKPITANRSAKALLDNPKIATRLRELQAIHLKRHVVTVDRVLQEFSRIAFLDIRKAFDDEGRLKPLGELDDETAAAIAGLEVEELYEGRGESRMHVGHLHKIKLSDKKGALDSLARHLGMFNDKTTTAIEGELGLKHGIDASARELIESKLDGIASRTRSQGDTGQPKS